MARTRAALLPLPHSCFTSVFHPPLQQAFHFCSALHQNWACNSIPFPSMHNPPLPVRCPRAPTQECYKEDTVIRHRFTKPFDPTFNNRKALSLSLP